VVAFVVVIVTMSEKFELHAAAASVVPTLKATRVVEESGAGAVVVHVADCGEVESGEVV
jgi:hypothetical protein